MHKLNCDEARKLSIVDYLAQCGFCPQYIKEGNHWYLSPILQQPLQQNCTWITIRQQQKR